MPTPTPQDVLDFWRDAGPARWFKKDADFDTRFRERFNTDHEAAARGELDGWRATPEDTLALLLLLDQFPRNCFRGQARSFATDTQARDIADDAVNRGFDLLVEPALRNFFYLPFMHSEALADQERALALTAPLGEDAHKFARIHLDIIQRFGRFPHRNALLGRSTTPEEQAFLDGGGFAG